MAGYWPVLLHGGAQFIQAKIPFSLREGALYGRLMKVPLLTMKGNINLWNF